MNELANISVANARVPQTYANAKSALQSCVSIDECQSWADKAAALASYAKQANDDELMKMATRIRDRAIRRAGELLKQIEPQQGRRTDIQPSGTTPTRSQAATDAGMSRDQMHTALRVANVPADQFETMVEGDKPPTVTALAEMGTTSAPRPVLDLKGRDPAEFNRALHFVAEFEDYAKAVAAFDIDQILPGLIPAEAARVRRAIGIIDGVHDRIITRI
jgi:hypothetical protein